MAILNVVAAFGAALGIACLVVLTVGSATALVYVWLLGKPPRP